MHRTTGYPCPRWAAEKSIYLAFLVIEGMTKRALASCFGLKLKQNNQQDGMMNHELSAALAELKKSVEFYEKINTATEAEKIAVGQDHYDWLICSAQKVALLS